MFASCQKGVDTDCSSMTQCQRTFYTYSTCTEGVYENVTSKTTISEPMSVCDTLQWRAEIGQAESTLYNSSDEVFREFMRQYPSKCNCSN